jgi:hypothetical protein
VEKLPATRAAFATGLLSETTAGIVAKAAVVDPSSEALLLETAQRRDLGVLREQARNVRLRAEDAQARHRRQHLAREFSDHIDDEGMVCGRFRLPPEVGTPIVNRIHAETDRVYRQAYKEGRREPRQAYAADALVKLLGGQGKGHATRADLVVVVDLDALKRGHTENGERCHIPGVGPIPASLARDIADNAFLKGVLIDGCDIKKVKHFGRFIKAELRTALELGPAPALDGSACVDCGGRHGLQDDHLRALANGGATTRDNLGKRCRPDHRDKTEQDRRQGNWGARDGRAPP